MKKKVYIAMSADIIHIGHLNIIKEASKYGDLTVGVLTDKAVASYKRLPFLDYATRSKTVESIKGVKNVVAGDADVLLVPSVETGNALVKMMIYFMGACAAGVVVGGKIPIVITSRSDEAKARLASIAAAVVALD